MLTTFTVLADIARSVAGDELIVESITKLGAETHGYEPTPGDVRKATEADLIPDNGLNLELWFVQRMRSCSCVASLCTLRSTKCCAPRNLAKAFALDAGSERAA